MECIQNAKITEDKQKSNINRAKETYNNNQSKETGGSSGFTKDTNTCKNSTEQKCGSNLRFGIDFLLKSSESSDAPLQLTCKKRDKQNVESHRNSFDKESELSDAESEVTTEKDDDGQELISSSSSLNLFGYPQLSVLIRQNNVSAQGPELRLIPPSLQFGAVGLHMSSLNDVRKDRFGCEYS